MASGTDNPANAGAQPSVPKVALQEYVDARFEAIGEVTRVAEQEREKSAAQLRLGLERAIEGGDQNLRDHIHAQIEAVNAALVSADKLERERISLVHEEIVALQGAVTNLFEEKQKALDAALIAQKEAVAEAKVATDRIAIRSTTDQEGLRADMQERLAAVRRELEQATAAQKEAVLKAESANEKRFQSVDEWKALSAERERTQAEASSKLVAQFMPREVAESQIAEVRRLADQHYNDNVNRSAQLQERVDRMAGRDEGTQITRSGIRQDSALAAQVKSLYIAVAAIIVGGGITLLASLITHGFTK